LDSWTKLGETSSLEDLASHLIPPGDFVVGIKLWIVMEDTPYDVGNRRGHARIATDALHPRQIRLDLRKPPLWFICQLDHDFVDDDLAGEERKDGA
jgi:hypothetical protein